MNSIKKFNTEEDLKKYINNLVIRNVGSGTEGYAALTKANDIIKYIEWQHRIPYDEEIITTADYKLESFNFPNKLILCKSHVAGYRTRYFNDNLLDTNGEKYINLSKLLTARKRMIEDIKVISKDKYRMNDIENNLLFDGERLCAIDTLDYRIVSNLTLSDNIELLDEAIRIKLCMIDPRIAFWNISTEDVIKRMIKEKEIRKINIYKKAV